MATQWHINGDYILACNGDYGCPCNFNARPTKGNCKGSIGIHVEDGAYDGVSLNGLNVFLGVKWPGAIYEGEGTVSIYIDESGSPEQRDALLKIVAGEAAGPPFEILAGYSPKSSARSSFPSTSRWPERTPRLRWALMTLLFVNGIMNLLWIAALAAFVLVEKVAPAKGRVSQVTGALLVAWGFFVLAAGL
jgi:hypothetical protein